jgi:hypothetical protein
MTVASAGGTLLKSLLICVVVLLLPMWVFAYQHAGHYYTVQSAFGHTAPTFDSADTTLIAFCAQLPDQSEDLDAVTTYSRTTYHAPFAWIKWGLAEYTDSEWVKRMVLVQQLLHGLTGGGAVTVQHAASTIATRLAAAVPNRKNDAAVPYDRNESLCALGFAMHLYGDSFAHREMSPARSQWMYSTGMGHAKDLHYPDYPLCAKLADNPKWDWHCVAESDGRFASWSGYMQSVYSLVYPNVQVPSAVSAATQKVVGAIQDLASSGSDYNDWNEVGVQRALAAPADPNALETFFGKHTASEPCQLVIDAARANGPLRGLPPLSCQNVWSRFASVARAEFKSNEPGIRQQQHLDPDPLYDTQVTPFW